MREELESAHEELEVLRDEEEDYYCNMPESIQDGKKPRKRRLTLWKARCRASLTQLITSRNRWVSSEK